MNIDEVIQQPGQKDRMLKMDILKSIHVAVPGEIVSYDADKRTAIVQPTVREWNSKDNPPMLLDVPVFMWGNFTFTPEKGDGCLVVCSDSCIDAWMQSGGINSPSTARVHSLSDGFAFVGFRQTGGTPLPETLASKADKVTDAVEGDFAGLDEEGNLTDSGHKHSDYKTQQEAVVDPTADGAAIEFIDTISQNENGVITATKKAVREASSTESGIVSTGTQTLSGTKTFKSYIRVDRGGTYTVTSGDYRTLLQMVFKSADGTYEHSTSCIGYIDTDYNGANSCAVLGSINGATCVGAGESADVMPKIATDSSGNLAYKSESLFLTSDGSIFMYPGCANDGSSYGVPSKLTTEGFWTTNLYFHPNSRYKYIYFYNNRETNTRVGYMCFDAGNATNYTLGRISFAEYSPNSTADTGTTGYYEYYRLPAATAGLTANAGYAIVTTKDAKNISRSGTNCFTKASSWSFSTATMAGFWHDRRLYFNALKYTGSTTGWVACGTLANEDDNPTYEMYGYLARDDASPHSVYEAKITTAGSVQIFNPPKNVNLWGVITYFV